MTFEDEFTEWQADMVDIALELTESRTEKIYLYGSIEGGSYFFNLFFQFNNRIVPMNKLNSVLNEGEKAFDIYSDRSWEVLHIGNNDLQEIEKVCKKYDKPTPTQFKLVYDVPKNNLKMKYEYGLMYSDNYETDTHEIFMTWFKGVKKEVEG